MDLVPADLESGHKETATGGTAALEYYGGPGAAGFKTEANRSGVLDGNLRGPVDFAAELARCDREIEEIRNRADVQSGLAPAWLVTLGLNDWEHEKGLIMKEQTESLEGRMSEQLSSDECLTIGYDALDAIPPKTARFVVVTRSKGTTANFPHLNGRAYNLEMAKHVEWKYHYFTCDTQEEVAAHLSRPGRWNSLKPAQIVGVYELSNASKIPVVHEERQIVIPKHIEEDRYTEHVYRLSRS